MAAEAAPAYDSYYYGAVPEDAEAPIEEAPVYQETQASRRTAVEDVEQELQTLRFYKEENENALKQAIERSREYKSKGGKYSWAAESVRERQQWLQRVVEEEQHKPLEVTAEFVKSFQEREKLEAERWRTAQARRDAALRRIQDQERQKEEIRALWREKTALQKRVAAATGSDALVPPGSDPNAFPGLEGGSGGAGIEAADAEGADAPRAAAGRVHANLARLMELEARIAELEREHLGLQPEGPAAGSPQRQAAPAPARGAGKVGAARAADSPNQPYPPFGSSIPIHSDANPFPVVTETPAVPGQQRLVFVKKRTEATLTQPSRVYYVVRIRQADDTTETLQQPVEEPPPPEPNDEEYAYGVGLEGREGALSAAGGSRSGTSERRRRPGRSAGSTRSGAGGSSPSGAEPREASAWEQARAEREEKARQKAEKQRVEEERAERVDDMIEQWLADRQVKEQHRRKFLEQRKQRERDWVAALDSRKRALDAILQRNAPAASEAEGYAGGHGGPSREGRRSSPGSRGGAGSPSGHLPELKRSGSGGATGAGRRPGSRSATTPGSAGNGAPPPQGAIADDVGLQLSLLDAQQRSIERWRPVVGAKK